MALRSRVPRPRVAAVFGGSFNPPHVAHQIVCLYVLETAPVDVVWMIPCWRHPFHKPLAPFDDRLAMCRLAAAPFGDRVAVDDVERTLGGEASRTLDTLRALRARHPDTDLRLVIGSDVLGETDKWYRWEEVAALAPPLVVPRGGYAGGFALPAVSSTEVRARIAAGGDGLPLVSRQIAAYIRQHGLYRS